MEKPCCLLQSAPKAPKQADANLLIQKLAPFIEGRGGGKSDLAQAGGTKPSGVDQALKEAEQVLTSQLG